MDAVCGWQRKGNLCISTISRTVEEFCGGELKDMKKEHVLIAGMFISGLLRCNLAQQAQQCAEEMPEGG